jgi:hypothetical protein
MKHVLTPALRRDLEMLNGSARSETPSEGLLPSLTLLMQWGYLENGATRRWVTVEGREALDSAKVTA